MIDCNYEVVKMFEIPDRVFFLNRHPELFPEFQPNGALSTEVSARNIRIALEKGYHHFECMHRKLSGEPLPIEVTLVRVKYMGECVIAAYFRDLSEQKAIVQLAKQQAEAESASEAKSRFIANMSHEMRTPMNAILGITEIIMQNDTLPSDIIEALSKVYNSGDLLLHIINDILDLSKIEAGKLELIPAKYDVASLIYDAINLNMMRISSKPMEFKLILDENIPTALIGDELRIKQIFNNLLSNAFKYTQEGEVTLSISVEKTNQEEEGTVILVCTVSDTGQGMSEEQVSKLFSEYTRFNMDVNRTTEGTGLGLNITYNLIKLMGGEISVKSEDGKGSEFTVRLPQKGTGSGVLGKDQVEKLQKYEINFSERLTRPKFTTEPMPYGKILVVDDVESNLYVATGLMLPYGLTINTATSGFEAIERIKDGEVYDIVFMDHMMPKMDGIETTKKLRELGYTQTIIALTANTIIGQSVIFMDNSFDEFISKPIDIRQLDAVLKKFVRDKQPPEIIEAANHNKRNLGISAGGQTGISPKLAEIFARDATKLAKTLEEIQESDAYSEEDIRSYTISVHALKSALTNVRETELSGIAAKLEQTGRDKNTAAMRSETRAFLDKLWAVIEKHKLSQEENSVKKIVVEDRAYLKEKLFAIKNACEIYDKKTIKDTISELQQKEWSVETRKLLATIEEELLNGDFEAVAKATEEGNENENMD
jgi:signal transduction histidine kinase/DNA-binding response OmpR family regulator